ncbi:MAG: hypothetical protein RIC55_17785 [Pirellulaceae bacterium]
MRKLLVRVTVSLVLVILAANLIVAQTSQPRPVRRAKAPDFSKQSSDFDLIFFRDVFAQGLEGERPANVGAAPVASTGGPSTGDGGAEAVSGTGWAKVVTASAVENEIKKINITLGADKDIETPIRFQGNGHKVARREFSMIALLFAIIAEYDGDIRWKENAPGIRDTFARSAGNAKVGTIQAYNESKLRVQDIQDLVGGGSVTTTGESERLADWSKVCDRSPLMQRIETAHDKKLAPMTANASEFMANKEEIVHEANMVAAIAAALQKEGMEDAGDDDYDGFAQQMLEASRQIIDAVGSGDQQQATKAVGAIGQACTSCHEFYRA